MTETATQNFGGVAINIEVTCKGGMLGGMVCTNSLTAGTDCAVPRTQPVSGAPVWPTRGVLANVENIDRILVGLESGWTVEQILPGAEADSPASQNVATPDDQAPDKHTSKGKAKGKKGKKGGKGGKGRK